MRQPIYLVCGVSGSGKSWACRQVADEFNYIPHDRCWSHPTAKPTDDLDPKWGPPGSVSTHLYNLIVASRSSDKPVLTECPFNERNLREQLEANELEVIPIFVIEDPHIIAERYQSREGKPIPKSAFSRAFSIGGRARDWGCFYGTSKQVADHLKNIRTKNEQ